MADDPVEKAEDAAKEAMDPPGEDPKAPEPGPSGEEATDIGTPAEHESEVVAKPEPRKQEKNRVIPAPGGGQSIRFRQDQLYFFWAKKGRWNGVPILTDGGNRS